MTGGQAGRERIGTVTVVCQLVGRDRYDRALGMWLRKTKPGRRAQAYGRGTSYRRGTGDGANGWTKVHRLSLLIIGPRFRRIPAISLQPLYYFFIAIEMP